MLTFKTDHFNGITIHLGSKENEILAKREDFEAVLVKNVEKWKSEDYRGVWIQIPIDLSNKIEIFVKNGFEFHHAQKDYLMVTKWLPNTKNKIPEYSRTTLGVGGLCCDFEKRKILLIDEKYKWPGYEGKTMWKLPGGAVDSDEDLSQGVVREVFEETGIESEFYDILGWRHLNNFRFRSQDDLYYVCVVTPKSGYMDKGIQIDDEEIAKCRWFSFDDFFEMEEELSRTVTLIRNEFRSYVKGGKFKKKRILTKDISYHRFRQTWYKID